MTVDWIIAHLPIDNEGYVILQTFDDGQRIVIDPQTLSEMTASVSDPPTYAALSALPMAKWYQQYFDQWVAAGYIT